MIYAFLRGLPIRIALFCFCCVGTLSSARAEGTHPARTEDLPQLPTTPPSPSTAETAPKLSATHDEKNPNATRFYMGATYQLMVRPSGGVPYTGNGLNVKFRRVDKFDGFTPHIGLKFGQYIGAELGVLVTGRLSTARAENVPQNQALRLRSWMFGPSLDFMGYYPAVEGGGLDLVGTTGFTLYTMELQIQGSGASNFKKTYQRMSLGVRMGGGLLWHVNDNLDVRFLTQYQLASYRFGKALPGNFLGNGLLIFSLGASYVF